MGQPYSLHDVRLELEREAAVRRGAYEKWKAAGKMPNGKPVDRAQLDAQLAKMEKALSVIAWFEQHEEAVKWLFKNKSDLKALWTWWQKTKQEDEAVKALHENFPGLELAETSA